MRSFFSLFLLMTAFAREDMDLSEKIIQTIQRYPEKVMEALYGEASLQKDMGDVFKKIESFVQESPVPTLGSGKKNIYVFVSPYCPHCQGMMKHIFQVVSDSEKGKKYCFHIFWVSDKEDKPSRLACRSLLEAHRYNIAKLLCKKFQKKLNFLEKKDFKNFQTENNIVFERAKDHEKILEKINGLVQSIDAEGFPALFHEGKSILGCPEKFSEFCKEIEEMTA